MPAMIIAVMASFAIVIYNRINTRKIIKNLNRMLDMAMDGTFTEKSFDESLLSSLEAKLNRYLSASEVSSQNLRAEKDKIKTLIADISHQTKTPIANILLYSQLLLEQELTCDMRPCVEALSSQAEKLNFLIASLVKLSRLETGILELSPSVNEIQPLLNDVEMQFASKASEKNIDFVVYPSEASAVFDRKWTLEAVCNLVDNAIKYTDDGGKVTVSVISYEMFICIQVSDTGIGINEDEQAEVFTRFYRSQRVVQEEGVGIGLYLVRQILALQGGYVKVSSEAGKGSVFYMYLSSGS